MWVRSARSPGAPRRVPAGPWEQVASNVAEGLLARGHEVTLFYEEDAQVTPKVHEALHIARLWSRRIASTSSTTIRLPAACLVSTHPDAPP